MLVLVLGLDDSLLVHEAAEQNGIPQAVFFLPYAVATLLLAVMLVRGESRGMVLAFALGAMLLALSVFMDQVAPGHHLLEDGAKLLGALLWLAVPVIACAGRHRPADSTVGGDARSPAQASKPHRGRKAVGAVAAAVALVAATGAALWTARGDGGTPGDHGLAVATGETEPMPHEGDSADDSAIWVHPDSGARSTIIGTDKRGGIAVYDLTGDELQYLPHGEFNNVDLRADFSLGGEPTTVVAASDRSDNTLAVYRVDASTGTLRDAAARIIDVGIAIYGLCLYRDEAGETYAFVNSKDGDLQQWHLVEDAAGFVDAVLVRSLDAGGQLEGCVADDELGQLYLGEEDVGIWAYDASPEGGDERTLVAEVSADGPLVADVEGLAVVQGSDGERYLVASSQGNNTFVVYRQASPPEHVGTFAIAEGPDVDGVSQTDGIDVTTADLGPAFPPGLFVAHDGDNDDENQNFKLVPWDAIATQLTP